MNEGTTEIKESVAATDSVGQLANSVNPGTVVAAVVTSIGGLLVHNLAEFPLAILLGPETLVPVAVTTLLGAAMLRRPVPAISVATAGWALVVIVFGGGSVLPVSILPFVPDQTVGHYVVHGIYAFAQLPLLLVALRRFRRSRRPD